MKVKYIIPVLLLCGVALGGAGGGCDNSTPSSDQVQRQAQEQLSQASNMQVGMPTITRFAEKRAMKDILELRDQMLPTYTYLVTLDGHVGDLICVSVGYGLDGATQYTNPMKLGGSYDHGYVAIPQADPNGLFSPASTEGTWILCKDPTPGSTKILPVRSEPRVITSPFKLK